MCRLYVSCACLSFAVRPGCPLFAAGCRQSCPPSSSAWWHRWTWRFVRAGSPPWILTFSRWAQFPRPSLSLKTNGKLGVSVHLLVSISGRYQLWREKYNQWLSGLGRAKNSAHGHIQIPNDGSTLPLFSVESNHSPPRVINVKFLTCSLTRNITSHNIWRTWLFIAYSDERGLYYQTSTTSLKIHFS